MAFQTLDTTGFLLTDVSSNWAVFSAEFGDGIASSKTAGDPRGVRTWSMRVDALPDTNAAPTIEDSIDPDRDDTRAQYLWRFFRRSKSAGNEPFWFECDDPDDGQRKKFLANFADNKLTYTVLCAKLYSIGLVLRQRRLSGVSSPVSV